MTARPHILAETTWTTVRDAAYEVAVLPWGATEAHNYHRPYGTDSTRARRPPCWATWRGASTATASASW